MASEQHDNAKEQRDNPPKLRSTTTEEKRKADEDKALAKEWQKAERIFEKVCDSLEKQGDDTTPASASGSWVGSSADVASQLTPNQIKMRTAVNKTRRNRHKLAAATYRQRKRNVKAGMSANEEHGMKARAYNPTGQKGNDIALELLSQLRRSKRGRKTNVWVPEAEWRRKANKRILDWKKMKMQTRRNRLTGAREKHVLVTLSCDSIAAISGVSKGKIDKMKKNSRTYEERLVQVGGRTKFTAEEYQLFGDMVTKELALATPDVTIDGPYMLRLIGNLLYGTEYAERYKGDYPSDTFLADLLIHNPNLSLTKRGFKEERRLRAINRKNFMELELKAKQLLNMSTEEGRPVREQAAGDEMGGQGNMVKGMWGRQVLTSLLKNQSAGRADADRTTRSIFFLITSSGEHIGPYFIQAGSVPKGKAFRSVSPTEALSIQQEMPEWSLEKIRKLCVVTPSGQQNRESYNHFLREVVIPWWTARKISQNLPPGSRMMLMTDYHFSHDDRDVVDTELERDLDTAGIGKLFGVGSGSAWSNAGDRDGATNARVKGRTVKQCKEHGNGDFKFGHFIKYVMNAVRQDTRKMVQNDFTRMGITAGNHPIYTADDFNIVDSIPPEHLDLGDRIQAQHELKQQLQGWATRSLTNPEEELEPAPQLASILKLRQDKQKDLQKHIALEAILSVGQIVDTKTGQIVPKGAARDRLKNPGVTTRGTVNVSGGAAGTGWGLTTELDAARRIQRMHDLTQQRQTEKTDKTRTKKAHAELVQGMNWKSLAANCCIEVNKMDKIKDTVRRINGPAAVTDEQKAEEEKQPGTYGISANMKLSGRKDELVKRFNDFFAHHKEHVRGIPKDPRLRQYWDPQAEAQEQEKPPVTYCQLQKQLQERCAHLKDMVSLEPPKPSKKCSREHAQLGVIWHFVHGGCGQQVKYVYGSSVACGIVGVWDEDHKSQPLPFGDIDLHCENHSELAILKSLDEVATMYGLKRPTSCTPWGHAQRVQMHATDGRFGKDAAGKEAVIEIDLVMPAHLKGVVTRFDSLVGAMCIPVEPSGHVRLAVISEQVPGTSIEMAGVSLCAQLALQQKNAMVLAPGKSLESRTLKWTKKNYTIVPAKEYFPRGVQLVWPQNPEDMELELDLDSPDSNKRKRGRSSTGSMQGSTSSGSAASPGIAGQYLEPVLKRSKKMYCHRKCQHDGAYDETNPDLGMIQCHREEDCVLAGGERKGWLHISCSKVEERFVENPQLVWQCPACACMQGALV